MIECPKCKEEHEPTGIHEDDSGEMECESCGFAFVVYIEYDPSYEISCVVHQFGEMQTISGTDAQFCVNCGKCRLAIEASA